MDKLIESMSNINVRKNDGYLFIKRDEIYVPIMKTILSITKRSFYSLPLLDEIVLRLINEGIQEIDELVNILGIDRNLLEVTLADLSVKDVIYCTTNRCSLLAKGKQALRELRTVQRKKDRVKNVYLDPINRKIILEHENYQFVDRVNVNDKKLDADFEVNDIEIFKENIDSVNKVFLDEMNIYNDKTKSEPDELLSIDSIENVYVKFVRIPIYIYVSSEGIDIDIMAVNKRNDPLLVLFKSEIIEQIRKKKVLKNIFVKYGLRKTFLGVDLEENENLKNDLQKYRKNKGDRDELEPIIEKEILSDRKLSDEEFEVLLKYLADKCENCKINVYHLDDWAKSEWCSKVLSVLNGKKLSEIGYAECYDFRKALSIIQRTMPEQEEFRIRCRSALDGLETLLQSLLEISKMETGLIQINKKKLPLMDTVISAVNRTYPKADEKEIEFVFDYEKELETCTIMQDKRWLGEAVINVLDNAVKYSPCGSKIFIRLQKRNDLVRMEIEDQGIGIPQNEYHKIFQRFYRGSSREVMEKSGTGIGLFLSREIIEKHAGTITVTSGKKKKGSTFVIQLPYVG